MAAEKMNLRNRQRDEELLSLQTQVQQLQVRFFIIVLFHIRVLNFN